MISGELFSEELFARVLLDPAKRGSRELFIVSGYTSAAMVTKHFELASNEVGVELTIDLHVGMTGRDGLSRNTLLGLQSIPRQIGEKSFNCTLSTRGTSNHSKLFVWCDDSGPREAFMGSSNYTQFGFGLAQASQTHKEICVEINPQVAFEYAMASSRGGISYKSPDIAEHIDLYDEQEQREQDSDGTSTSVPPITKFFDLPLVMQRPSNRGEVHHRSGLNWGQRENRNPDQAYIPVPAGITRTGLLPEKGVHFQVITDDGEAFICAVAQDGGKAIETPHDNSILGKYFRRRLGLPEGSYVTKEHLISFGSNVVRMTKLNEDTYRLSFQPGLMFD